MLMGASSVVMSSWFDVAARESRCRAANREVEGGEEGPQKVTEKMRERRVSGNVGESYFGKEKHWVRNYC